jgi:anti-sigma factor ChrR (cupin superfamily)
MKSPRLLTKLLDQLAVLEFGLLRPGVQIASLAGDANDGPHAAILRYEPGAHVPAHRHVGFEVIYVLKGSQRDERGTYGPGALVVNRPGDEHTVESDDGCTVLIFWEKPVEFLS